MSPNLQSDVLPATLGGIRNTHPAFRQVLTGKLWWTVSWQLITCTYVWLIDRDVNKWSRNNLINCRIEHLNMSLHLRGVSYTLIQEEGFHVSWYLWWCFILITWKWNRPQSSHLVIRTMHSSFLLREHRATALKITLPAKCHVLTCPLTIYFKKNNLLLSFTSYSISKLYNAYKYPKIEHWYWCFAQSESTLLIGNTR